jgi:hypothetical protein
VLCLAASHLLEIAPTLCGRAAFHVWHMKVLHYAVFKDRGADSPHDLRAGIRKDPARSVRAGTLKAEQYSLRYAAPFARSTSSFGRSWSEDHFASSLLALEQKSRRIVYRETLTVRAAQRMFEDIRPFDLILPLAIIGRENPDLVASSVVDLECTPARSR